MNAEEEVNEKEIEDFEKETENEEENEYVNKIPNKAEEGYKKETPKKNFHAFFGPRK